MSVLERDDEGRLIEFCKATRIRCLKLRLASENSWPDRTLLYRGHVMFLELKKKNESPTPLQMYTLEQLVKENFIATWSDNLEDMKRIIINWKRYVDGTETLMAEIRQVHSPN